jgi:hypothetical protein
MNHPKAALGILLKHALRHGERTNGRSKAEEAVMIAIQVAARIILAYVLIVNQRRLLRVAGWCLSMLVVFSIPSTHNVRQAVLPAKDLMAGECFV